MVKTVEIDGKKYIVKKFKHKAGNDKVELMPFNKKEYDEKIDRIIEQIHDTVDSRELLRQAFSSLEWDYIEKIEKSLKHKAKPKSKKGCYEIKIGRNSIPIVD